MDPTQIRLEDDMIRERAREILDQSEFRQQETAYVLQKWLSRLSDWLEKFQEWSAKHPVYTWMIIIGLIIILILLIVHIVYTAFGDSFVSSRSKLMHLANDRSLEVLEGKAASWSEGLEKAKSALASGQSHEAIWIGHRVLLGLLDELGCIQFQGFKTNTTYLRELNSQNTWYDLLQRFTQTYEMVIYGSEPCESGDIQRLLGEVVDCMKASS